MKNKILNILRLIRIEQWTKNAFVFLPLFFDRHLLEWSYWQPSLIAFFAFSFAASGIYCFNDIYDVEADRLHPKKCKRPIASGAISIAQGYVITALCWLVSAGLLLTDIFALGNQTWLWVIILSYVVMNLAYSTKLKQIPILDVFIIAIGFVLRVFAGGVNAHIYISHWIVLMTFLLALFLAFAKRRDDVVEWEATGTSRRKGINKYNTAFMNQAMTIVATLTMVCYIMYTISDSVMERIGNQYLYITSVFVLAGIIRYLQIAIVDVKSGSPTKILLKDRFIQLCIAGWLIAFAIILYV